ncbi:hypothetical protein ACVWY3_003185 [Bradyrhizobium sp. USDA 4486]
MGTALGNGAAMKRRAAIVRAAARPPYRVWPGSLLAILVSRKSAPVAADGLMVVARRGLAGVFGLAALGLGSAILRCRPSARASVAMMFMLVSLMGGSAVAKTLNFDNSPVGMSPEG